MSKTKSKIGLTQRRNMLGYLFILPFIIGLFIIFIPSVVESFLYAFQKIRIDLGSISSTPVGWLNYKKAFTTDTEFRVILQTALRGMTIDTLIILIFSFFIANILNQKFIGRGVARTIFFLPVILATGIVASTEIGTDLFNAMSNNTGDAANVLVSGNIGSFDLETMLLNSGLNSSITGTVVYAIKNTYSIVNSSGVQILIFISALQSISPSIFEAAKVEGATKWEEFWKITFPILTPMILVAVIYTIVDTFTNPEYKVISYIQDVAFGMPDIGYASALSWLYFLIVAVVLSVISFLISRRVQYLD